jgi:hypothetical protein
VVVVAIVERMMVECFAVVVVVAFLLLFAWEVVRIVRVEGRMYRLHPSQMASALKVCWQGDLKAETACLAWGSEARRIHPSYRFVHRTSKPAGPRSSPWLGAGSGAAE